MNILVLNTGSSSLKCSLFRVETGADIYEALPPLWEVQEDWPPAEKQPEKALAALLEKMCSGSARILESFDQLDAVGHRVVHGASLYTSATKISAKVQEEIGKLSKLAPLHNPRALEVISAVSAVIGERVPQIAVFDTAFHATLPPAAITYPGPYAWLEQGIRRFGFHGISHEYVSRRASRLLQREVSELELVTCHLGNGCSLAAISSGRSVDTTMGFTPLDGVMMGSRPGSLDPGILLHLLREGVSAADLERTLTNGSGLLGVSCVSNDLRKVITAATQGNAKAVLALEVFSHSIARGICSMLSSLSRLDAIVFTGGVGENAASTRASVCGKLGALNIRLAETEDEGTSEDRLISCESSNSAVLVVHTEEDWNIAVQCMNLLSKQ